MPKSRITRVTVSHVWEEGATDNYDISRPNAANHLGREVCVVSRSGNVTFFCDSWDEIRDQIDAMFDEMEREHENEIK